MSPSQSQSTSANISQCSVSVTLGDMTRVRADAYIVPEFNNAASFGGVGGAVARSGGEEGMIEFGRQVEGRGRFEFGDVVITPSGGGNSKYLIHVVSVGSNKLREFKTVHDSVLNGLLAAKAHDIKSIACPALGTGIIGALTPIQSAKAMLSAVQHFAETGGVMKIDIVIFGGQEAFRAFSECLKSGSYKDAAPELGEKDFDLGTWKREMAADKKANHRHDADKN